MAAPNPQDHVTLFLEQLRAGDPEAVDRLMPHLYAEMREVADGALRGQRQDHTLQPTALVNEAYLRLVEASAQDFENRRHFLSVAAMAMRQILADHARKRSSAKRGGDRERIMLEEAQAAMSGHEGIDLVELDAALTRLRTVDERQARIVELRFLAGMTYEDIAKTWGSEPVPRASIGRWRAAGYSARSRASGAVDARATSRPLSAVRRSELRAGPLRVAELPREVAGDLLEGSREVALIRETASCRDRNFIVDSPPLATSWPDEGPPVLWERPLGTGHSAILVDEGRLYTMYRVGNGREKAGPFDLEERVVALDARTGETLWEYVYASGLQDFNFGAGPHSTPLLVGDRLFTVGTNKKLFAFDKRTGDLLWSVDLVKDLGAPSLLIRAIVKAGYGCSPLAYRDTLICSVGGPGQSVVAFRQSDGSVAWSSGDFLVSQVPPVLIEVEGRTQLVVVGGGTVNGLDPDGGKLLWSYPHDPGNDLNCSMPWFGPDGVLVVSSAYKAGSRALRLTRDGELTRPKELWFTARSRFMFLGAVRIGGHIYGTSGDFGPTFLMALDVETGEPAWRQRGFARGSLLYADGKGILLDEDGDLALLSLSPEGAEVLARTKLFETTAWTIPTLAGTTLYARDRETVVALELGVK